MKSTISNNIILIGYRGTGKSVVADSLQKITNMSKISIDDKIVRKYGQIPDFVKKHGWERFRKVETEILKAIDGSNVIIDCGGGIVEKSENVKILKNIGQVFWLCASMEQIEKRLIDKIDRPALTKSGNFLQEIKEVLSRRIPLYKSVADFVIDTDSKQPDDIVSDILKCLQTQFRD